MVMASRLGGQTAQIHGQNGAGEKTHVLADAGSPGSCCGVQDMAISNLFHHRNSNILFACAMHVLHGYVAEQGSACSTQYGGIAEERKLKLVSTRCGDFMLKLFGCHLTLSKVLPLLPGSFSAPASITCPQESIQQ